MNKKIFITALISSLFAFLSCSGGNNMNDIISDTQNSLISSNVEKSLVEPNEEGYIYKSKAHFQVDYDDENLKKELEKHLNLLPEHEKERLNSIKNQGYYKLKGNEIDVTFLSQKNIEFTFTKNDVRQADSKLIAFNLPISNTLKYSIGFELHIDLLGCFLKDNITYSIALQLNNKIYFEIFDSICMFEHSSLIELKEVR